MVTTFNPPARKRPAKKPKPKPPVALIGLGVLCVVLLIVVINLSGKLGKANDRAAMLSESVVEVAGIAGAEGVTAESLADAETAAESLEALRTAASGVVTELDTATAQLGTARAEVARIQGELDTANEALSSARSNVSKAESDLKQRDAELSEQQAKYEADVAALNADIDALNAELDGLRGEISAAAEEDVSEEGALEEESDVDAAAAGADVQKGKPESSKHFSSYTYDTAGSSLTLKAKSGESIKFYDVPETVYASISNAPVFDLFFRFELMDVYDSKPDAREFIINLND